SHMMARSVLIDSPWSEYSGKTTRSIVGLLCRALPTNAHTRAVCASRSVGVWTTGFWSCTKPITTPLGVLLRPPSPLTATSIVTGDDRTRAVRQNDYGRVNSSDTRSFGAPASGRQKISGVGSELLEALSDERTKV